ncbi:MAG: class I SAM-dependent methyltransferase [Vulcanimicrobiota bacterium]
MQTPRIMNEELWEMHLSRQFYWTRKLREMLYDKVNLKDRKRILDAGCGIGLISKEMHEISGGEVHGIDFNSKILEVAEKKFPEGNFQQGSIEDIPFEDNFFDVAFCHFVLMWVKNPYKAIGELKRVTRPGGWIVCAAEPDYGGKIDYPDDYGGVNASIRALQSEGADPFFGRVLKATFSENDLKPEMGVHADLWDDETMKKEFEHVWEFSAKTAKGNMMKNWVNTIKQRDKEAIEKGQRVTLLPLFWGIAQK